MAVTEWEVIGPGVVAGNQKPTMGTLVNGGGTTAPTGPSSGRGFPR